MPEVDSVSATTAVGLLIGFIALSAFLVSLLMVLGHEQQRKRSGASISPYTLWGHKVYLQIPKPVFPPPDRLAFYDELFDQPEHGYFDGTYQHTRLHYRKYLPYKNPDKPKAVVLWQHGIHGQSGYGMKRRNGAYTCFALRARLFRQRGLAVYAHDQLGHGFSEGERFLIPDGNWRINANDFVQFAKFVAQQHDPDIPIFFMGDSYGACVVLHAAKLLQDAPTVLPNFRGILINCPAIIGDVPPAPIVFVLRNLLAPVFQRWTPFFMPHPVNPNRIWKEDEPKEYHADPRQFYGLSFGGQPFCLGTAKGLLDATKAVREEVIPHLKVPFHVNHGNMDYAVPIDGSHFLMKHSQTPEEDKTFHIIEGGYHDLFSDSDAEQHLTWEMEWIESRLDKPLKY